MGRPTVGEAIEAATDKVAEELTKERMDALTIANHRGAGLRTRNYYAARAAVLGKLLDSMDEPGFNPSPVDLREVLA